MKHYSILSILAGVCLLTHVSTSSAQQTGEPDVPRTISYQGMLTSADGVPLPDGNRTVTVALYGDEAGTQLLWQDGYQVTTHGGVFNLYLGSNRPLPSSSQMNRPLWVGTAIDGQQEMRPLTPLSASPYALNLPDRAVTTGKIADGAVTADKVEMDYVKGFRVNGQEISAKGAILDIRGSDDIALRYDSENNVLNIGSPPLMESKDAEKAGATIQATNNDVWTMRGNGRSLAAGFPLVAPAAGDYLGTNNAVTFELRTNNQTAMRYQPNGTNTPDVLGGHSTNAIGSGVGNVIAGGGSAAEPNTIGSGSDANAIGGGQANVIGDSIRFATIGGGQVNSITEDYSTIAGGGGRTTRARSTGDDNHIRSQYGFIGGGRGNWIDTLAHDATIAGGIGNTIVENTYVDSYIPNESGGTIGGGGGNIVTGYYATIAGGHHNEATGHFSFVGGGGHATHGPGGNIVKGNYSAIVGGETNFIDTLTNWGVISGGRGHIIETGDWTTIAGGDSNLIQESANASTISGGSHNNIQENAISGVIGGGQTNSIQTEAQYGAIGGGKDNVVGTSTQWATIAGGHGNKSLATHATIGGGHVNEVSEPEGTIGGGWLNSVSALRGTIGGGDNNGVTGMHGTIAGGQRNTVTNTLSTISGGYEGIIRGSYGFIGAGQQNLIDTTSNWGVISGGRENKIGSSSWAAIAGGEFNRIDSGANWSAIGGGDSNTIVNAIAQHAIIAGGIKNRITNFNGAIGGGRSNSVTEESGTIGGGHLNLVEAIEGFVGGGRENEIGTGSEKAVIAGGGWNVIEPNIFAGTIGGGSGHLLRAGTSQDVSAMTIPGGDNLIAQSWAQTVIGGWNTAKGAVPTRYGTTPPNGGLRNGPIFIVGNGFDENNRSNAFEVSYNGHSIVFHKNGTGGAGAGTARGAVRGGTYTDNVIYGWGEVSAAGTLVCNDFGIASITHPRTGTYRITLNPVGPDGLTAETIDCGAVVATLSGGDPGAEPAPTCNTFIKTSTIQNNVFEVYISRFIPWSGTCEPADEPFKFHVTGRPQS